MTFHRRDHDGKVEKTTILVGFEVDEHQDDVIEHDKMLFTKMMKWLDIEEVHTKLFCQQVVLIMLYMHYGKVSLVIF